MGTGDAPPQQGRWDHHPFLSTLLHGAVFLLPIAFSIVSATALAHLLPAPHALDMHLVWWVAVLGVPTAVLVVTDRVARRALPLVVLLKMTMVFPDQAPKRLAVARRAATTRDLARRVEEARQHGTLDEPTEAAEKILTLAAALNAHDRMTRGHAERVRAVTDLIAEEMHLPAEDRERLRWSALLHDIGKLAVHPHVLNKPDKLDDDEWELVRDHPLEGAKLTAPLAGWLGPWASTIAEHHERYDGKGYPHGLVGDEISLGGRIVGVADSYDVMTSVRSYKRPVSAEQARSELAACAGSQFDPHVVRAFLDVSIGKLRAVAGPLSWVGALPFLGNASQVGQLATTLGRAASAAVVVGGSALGATAVAAKPAPAPYTATHLLATPGAEGRGATSGGTARDGSADSANSDGAGGATQSDPPSGDNHLTDGGSSSANDAAQGGDKAGGDGAGGGSGPGADAGGSPGGTTESPTTPTTTPTTSISPTTSPPEQPQSGSLTVAAGTSTQPGRPQQGNEIIVTFSPVPNLSSLCSAWTSTSYPELDDSGVVVTGSQPASGDDTLTVSDATDCSGGLHFGTVDLGERGFFNSASVTFGGSSGTCGGSKTSGCSTITWNGANTLTITFGVVNNGQPTQSSPSVAVYTPDAHLGLVGTISSPKQPQF